MTNLLQLNNLIDLTDMRKTKKNNLLQLNNLKDL